MKKAILISLFLTINFSVNAVCMYTGINLWPTQQYISTNSIFVIEGYNGSQDLIRQLNKKNKIYLTCNSERISIKVLRILEGQFLLTQAILKPERELINGKTYELHIDSLGEYDKDEYKVVKWTVNSISDNEKPIWDCEPNFKGYSYSRMGCGPSKHVHFCGSFIDNSPTLIYAKVFDKKNKTNSHYFIKSEDQQISLGHGMCGGAFFFEEGVNYEVQFGLMDASGNENLELTEPIDFINPNKNNNSKKAIICDCQDYSNLLIYSLVSFGLLGFGLFLYKKRKNLST